MAIPVILPKQGQSVETCAIVGWKKHVGDAVKSGDILCEVETDKASFEIESPADGALLAIYFEAGSQVPVLTTIAAIGKPGEKVDQPALPTAPSRHGAIDSPPPAAAPAPTVSAAMTATGSAVQPPRGKIAVSPRARALASASAVSLAGIRGTGPGGRIIERDVKLAMAGSRTPSAAPTATPAPAGGVREMKVTGIRKLIAERMLASLTTTAQLTMSSSADARSLQEFRARFKESPETLGLRDVTINDMVLFAVSRALLQHADMNAHFTGDAIRQFADVHLGFAVDTPRGLMVPVVRAAHTLGLRAIARETERLAAACREGRITPDELGGGTFTVTNLGGLGVETFTPVLNPPQVGILGVGAIVARAVQGADGSVSFIPQIGLSLTINHQAVDGAPGARFLQTVAGLIARFDLLLAQ